MDYSRQESLVKHPLPPIQVIGCGGVGSWVALFCALGGVTEIELYDGDCVEPSNLARTPYLPRHVGEPKADALAEILREYRPGIGAFSHGLWRPGTRITSPHPATVVIGAVDGTDVRVEISAYAAEAGLVYLDVGAEATGWNISDSPSGWIVPTTPREHGYYTPIFIAPVAMAASAVTWTILALDRPPRHFRFDATELRKE